MADRKRREPVEREEREMPSAPLPAWIRARLNTIKSDKDLRRLLRTEYIGKMAHPAWRKWAEPKLVASRKAASPYDLDSSLPSSLQRRQQRQSIRLKTQNKRVQAPHRQLPQ